MRIFNENYWHTGLQNIVRTYKRRKTGYFQYYMYTILIALLLTTFTDDPSITTTTTTTTTTTFSNVSICYLETVIITLNCTVPEKKENSRIYFLMYYYIKYFNVLAWRVWYCHHFKKLVLLPLK